MNSFVGRTTELDEIAKLLTRTRLLTLRGPGGVGKTRLALRAARNLRDDYPDGVWVAELSAETDGGLLIHGVAGVFGLHTPPQQNPPENRRAQHPPPPVPEVETTTQNPLEYRSGQG
ncbi:AAA family ATPase, partial [Streptosporangium sp. NPDC048865]|uniref:AAA family ATPase n=1 Tax=Streptosporangium sp. NPDC048865 TaxID=3155766 RepID=UPI00343EECB8